MKNPIRCDHPRCKWRGYETDLKRVPLQIEGVTQSVCPACGHGLYSFLTPGEIKAWKNSKEGQGMSIVQLQVNERGAWRNVMQFDKAQIEIVEAAVVQLHEAAPTSRWRIATCERLPTVLRHLGDNTHGIWIKRGPLA